jgi:hypothetical protein
MRGNLFLDLQQYSDPESQQIAVLAAKRDELGAAWSFIRNRRSLADFKAYLKGDRQLCRILKQRRGEPHWSDPY